MEDDDSFRSAFTEALTTSRPHHEDAGAEVEQKAVVSTDLTEGAVHHMFNRPDVPWQTHRPTQERLARTALAAYRRARENPMLVAALDWIWYYSADVTQPHETFNRCCALLDATTEEVFHSHAEFADFNPSRALNDHEGFRVLHDLFIAKHFYPQAGPQRRMFMALCQMLYHIVCQCWNFQRPLHPVHVTASGGVFFRYGGHVVAKGHTRRHSRSEGSPTMSKGAVYHLTTPPLHWPAGLSVTSVTDAQALAILMMEPDRVGMMRRVFPAVSQDQPPMLYLNYPVLWDGMHLVLLADYMVSGLSSFAPGTDMRRPLGSRVVVNEATFMKRSDGVLIPVYWAPFRIKRAVAAGRHRQIKPSFADGLLHPIGKGTTAATHVVEPWSWENGHALLAYLTTRWKTELSGAISTTLKRESQLLCAMRGDTMPDETLFGFDLTSNAGNRSEAEGDILDELCDMQDIDAHYGRE